MLLLTSFASLGASPKAMAKEADRLYKDGRYREAADTLRAAYQAEPNPLFLYNIARALDQAGEVSPALDAYRQYVSQSSEDTQPELVKKANLAMDRLRTMAAKAEADRQVQDQEKKRLEDERKKADAQAADERRAALEQRQAYEAKEKAARESQAAKVNSQLIGSLVLGGVAVVGLGTALGFGLAANGTKGAFQRATTLADKQGLEAATKTQALVADLSLLVGIGAGVAAAILFPKGPAPSGQVKVVLTPIGGGGLAAIGGTF
jgi:tetratricopeptide (TPR) repeat protein